MKGKTAPPENKVTLFFLLSLFFLRRTGTDAVSPLRNIFIKNSFAQD